MLPNLHKAQVTIGGVTLTLRLNAYLPETQDRLYDVKGYPEAITLTGREVALNGGTTA